MPIDRQRWQRLSPWLDQVLDLPTEQRQAWIDDLASRDAALAADLRALLAGKSAGDGAQVLYDASPATAMLSLAGRRVGAYTLLRPLGEGGMGAVWLAERSDGRFEGRAAVKLLHAGLVQRALAERFRREGAILARLAHPHIARLVDAGLTEEGQPFLVLEHVAGERIDRWCDARRMDVRSRIALFSQVLQAVQHAHTQLVVHRDLKPANVMVDGDGAVKLLDFGIAKLIDDEGAADATELTREAGRVLTPLYAAPEQTRGDTVTTATDVYALGLLLYLLLTGQHPLADALGRVAHLQGPPPSASRVVTDPSRRSPDELQTTAAARGTTPARLAHALAGDLDNILAKALRTEAAERYTTAAAFADDLQRHLDGHTVSARPDSWAYRTNRFVRRHKLGVGLSAASILAIVIAAGLAEHQRRNAEYERDVATRQRENAEAIVMFLGEQLDHADEPGSQADPGRRLDLAQRRAEQLFRDVPEVLVPIYGRLHSMNAALNRVQVSDSIAASLEAIHQRIADPILQAEVWCGAHRDGLSDADAVGRIDRGLNLLQGHPGGANTVSKCLFHRSSHFNAMARFDEALRDLDAAEAAEPELLRRTSAISYMRSRVGLLNELGQVHAAERVQQELIEQMKASGSGRSVRSARDLHWLCVLQWRMGRPREGLQTCEQSRTLAEGLGLKGLVPVVDVFRARILMDLEQPLAARKLLESALVRDGRPVPPFPRGVDFVARLYQLRGQGAEAVAALEQDLQQRGPELRNSRDTINRFELAAQYLERADANRALAVLAPLDAGFGERTFRWEKLWLRARAHNMAGQSIQAEAAARAALDEAARRGPPDGLSTLHGHAQLELARALLAQGRPEEARAAALRAADTLSHAIGAQHVATQAALRLMGP